MDRNWESNNIVFVNRNINLEQKMLRAGKQLH